MNAKEEKEIATVIDLPKQEEVKKQETAPEIEITEVEPQIIEPTTLKNAGKNIYRIFDVVNSLNEIYGDIYRVLKP